MDRSYSDKVVLITGGTSGIGRAAAIEAARKGATVVISGRRRDLGRKVVDLIVAKGGKAHYVYVDVSSEKSIEALLAETVDVFGKLDCAFNNAGISGVNGKKLADQSTRNWDSVISVNLRGIWLSMKYEILHMLNAGGGSIVNSSSTLGLAAEDWGVSPYIASKHGVVGLTRAAAVEYATDNLRVNAICPGMTDTAFVGEGGRDTRESLNGYISKNVPMKRIAEPVEIARAVLWLLSDDASYVTGEAFVLDGGLLAR